MANQPTPDGIRKNRVRRMADRRTDQDVVRLLGVEDVVRLEAEAAIAGDEFVGDSADARKIRQQAERPLEASMVCLGLIAPEAGFGEGVDAQHVVLSANGEAIFSHGRVRPPFCAPRPGSRPLWLG